MEKVEIRNPNGGLELRAFAVRPPQSMANYSYLTDPRQTLAEVGFETDGPQVVDVVCPAETDSRPWEDGVGVRLLGVEIVKPAEVDAWGEGLLVTYRTTRGRHTFEIPFHLALCVGEVGDGREACGR